MYESIIKKAGDITNIRGRYKSSAALLELEVSRILGSREFAFSYGRSEWLSDGMIVREVEVDSGDYKKLVVCLEDGSSHDITSEVSGDNFDISCQKNKSLTISESCGIITIKSETPIIAIRSIYKKSENESMTNFVRDNEALLISYLRWQLLSDIDAKSSAVGYNTYIGLLANLQKSGVVT